jgi:hypothetical protein
VAKKRQSAAAKTVKGRATVLRRPNSGRRGSTALPKIKMVAVRKNLDLVWVWFYKEVAPTALEMFRERISQ